MPELLLAQLYPEGKLVQHLEEDLVEIDVEIDLRLAAMPQQLSPFSHLTVCLLQNQILEGLNSLALLGVGIEHLVGGHVVILVQGTQNATRANHVTHEPGSSPALVIVGSLVHQAVLDDVEVEDDEVVLANGEGLITGRQLLSQQKEGSRPVHFEEGGHLKRGHGQLQGREIPEAEYGQCG
ncbi:hypothetical protein L7F22_051541 [Adiantum nelumboides]|nr:hypothetical protein [Adiantum nelumboides]